MLNDTQIYTLWEFSMPNTNIENKTLEFLPEEGLRKVQWICKQQRQESSLLNLALEVYLPSTGSFEYYGAVMLG